MLVELVLVNVSGNSTATVMEQHLAGDAEVKVMDWKFKITSADRSEPNAGQ